MKTVMSRSVPKGSRAWDRRSREPPPSHPRTLGPAGATLQDAEHLMQWTATPRHHAGAWVALRVDNQEGRPLPVEHEDLLMAGNRVPGLLWDPNVLRADRPHSQTIARPYALVRFRTARRWPATS